MGTDHELVKSTLSRNTRGKLSRSVINKTIPSVLRADARARRGVEAAELIVDPSSSPSKFRHKDHQDGVSSQPDGSEEASQPSITLTRSDTLLAAHNLHIQNTTLPPHRRPRIAILNMASPLRPGGGILSGATSQEESLCRRTTLYPSLRDEFYRLPEVGGVYTPDVVVFNSGRRRQQRVSTRDRDGSKDDGEEGGDHEDEDSSEGEEGSIKVDARKDWFHVDVITAAMLRFPDVVARGEDGEMENVYANQSDREMAVRKMRAVMRILNAKGIGQVVLGAWGCGAYGNPVGEIARAWRKVLLGGKTAGGGKKGKKPAEVETFGDVELIFAIKDGRMAEAFARAFGPGLEVLSDGVSVEGGSRDGDSVDAHNGEDGTF